MNKEKERKMVKGGERIMIVESLEGGNKKRKKDCSKGKREEQKRKERWRMVWKGEERKKNEREKRKTVQWLEMKKQKRDALERTSLNGYDE